MLKSCVLTVLIGLCLLLVPDRAEAKGIPLIYNTGEEAFPTGPLPAPFGATPELAGFQAGYMCNIKGVLWSYFSVSDCKPVAFKGDSYTDEPELVAAITAKYKESDMKKGIWGAYGWMLLLAAILLGGVFWVIEKVKGDKDDEEGAQGAS